MHRSHRVLQGLTGNREGRGSASTVLELGASFREQSHSEKKVVCAWMLQKQRQTNNNKVTCTWHGIFLSSAESLREVGKAGRIVLLDIEFALDSSFLLVLEIYCATSLCPLVSDKKIH